MEGGSSSAGEDKGKRWKGSETLGSMLPNIEPFVPKINHHNPKDLRSWAKRTGFVSDLSGESGISVNRFDLEKGVDLRGGGLSPKIEIDPVLGRSSPDQGVEIQPVLGAGRERRVNEMGVKEEMVLEDNDERKIGVTGNGKENVKGDSSGVEAVSLAGEPSKDDENFDGGVEMSTYMDGDEPGAGGWPRSSEMKLGLKDKPSVVLLLFYGLQHFLSISGSLIFIPVLTVPAMGGTDNDTASVISTMLLVSGITTIIHSYFGTRLPLVQGSSFVYLAPALVIMNSQEYRNLTEHKFRHIMRELQGSIIVGSIVQTLLGFTGLMSLFLRLINPVVVASTVAAVGLAFFSYGFPQAGSCVEISIPQIFLVLVFTLYLGGISIFGHRVFKIYAVPLSVVIIWIYAAFLTAGGAYDYGGCSPGIPSSNILADACIKHSYTMKHCRTDVSNAWKTTAWVRIPYPLQWGFPIFHLRTSIIMIMVSLVASVDSVGTYHSVSLRVNSRLPTAGTVSRGIALEGFCSILAGLWGSGTGSTTLTENTHTVDITKVASRRAVEVGALFLIICSFVGKVGAILASMPQALAASVLCFTWSLIVALGLSTLRYTQTASFRNITIVGVALFLGLSIPAYFQQFDPQMSLILPPYLIPYAGASNGPAHTGSKQLDFSINALLSLNMVVTLLVAFVLDNTVPGSAEERGLYNWSRPDDMEQDPSLLEDYSPPRKVWWLFGSTRLFGA